MSPMERKSGQDFQLSDEEILVAPIRLLNPAQRKRRRKLKTASQRENRRRVRKERVESGAAKVIFCQARKKNGEPCNTYAVTGVKHCVFHMTPAEREKTGIADPTEAARKTRLEAKEINGVTMNAPQTARQLMEVAVEKLIMRYFRAVGLEFQGWDENGVPLVYDKGIESGLMLYGESKDGYIEMSRHPDLMAQIQVIEKLWDRVYGKPKQTQVLEGGVKPIQVQPVRSVERAQRVARMLGQVGAVPHEGRRRPDPTPPATPSPSSDPANVIPLHDQD